MKDENAPERAESKAEIKTPIEKESKAKTTKKKDTS